MLFSKLLLSFLFMFLLHIVVLFDLLDNLIFGQLALEKLLTFGFANFVHLFNFEFLLRFDILNALLVKVGKLVEFLKFLRLNLIQVILEFFILLLNGFLSHFSLFKLLLLLLPFFRKSLLLKPGFILRLKP